MGTGPGRGIAFLYVLLATFSLLAIAVVWLYPRTRRVEIELPDHGGEVEEGGVLTAEG